MRNIFFAALLMACFVSCKKEKRNDTTNVKKQALSFNVSGFTQTTGPFTSSSRPKAINSVADTLSDYLDQLVFMVYDSQNRLIINKIHLSSEPNYTAFTDSLPAGTYTIAFIGSKNGLFIQTDNRDAVNDFFYYGMGMRIDPWKDCFYKKLSVTVAASPVQQTVQLDRVPAQLQLKITDPIPANVARLVLNYPEHFGFIILTGAPQTNNYTVSLYDLLTAADIGTTNHTVTAYTLNNGTPFDLIISAYDSDNELITQKTVLNVNCVRNKRTIISGSLFSGSSTFNVTTDLIWNPSVNHPF